MRTWLLTGVAALALLDHTLARADPVGTAGAANVLSSGTPPGGSMRVIEMGARVVSDEKIDTSPSGSVQLVFIDKTTLDIGPNSSIVIDKFVFDPQAARGVWRRIATTLRRFWTRLASSAAFGARPAT